MSFRKKRLRHVIGLHQADLLDALPQYLDDLERANEQKAELAGRKYQPMIDNRESKVFSEGISRSIG